MISATMSSEATAGKPIQINLLESNIRTGFAEMRDYYDFIGTMSITAEDGSNLMLTALDASDGLGTEWVEYSLISGAQRPSIACQQRAGFCLTRQRATVKLV